MYIFIGSVGLAPVYLGRKSLFRPPGTPMIVGESLGACGIRMSEDELSPGSGARTPPGPFLGVSLGGIRS